MIIEHRVCTYRDLIANSDSNLPIIDKMGYRKILTLCDSDNYSEAERAVVEAISFDIRGSYGYFLNSTESDKIEWTGNLYYIKIDRKNDIVVLQRFETNNESALSKRQTFPLKDWIETLNEWKDIYLHELGFLSFKSKALSHFLGYLVMLQDSKSVYIDEYKNENSDYNIILRKCAERYGISTNTILRDCRKVTGLYHLKDVFLWTDALLLNHKERPYNDFVKQHILNIDPSFSRELKEYLNLEL